MRRQHLHGDRGRGRQEPPGDSAPLGTIPVCGLSSWAVTPPAPDEVRALPGVAEVVTDKRELPDLLGRFGVVDIPRGISRFGNRHRAYIKVQDGCLLRCSYCIIPQVRPHVISRPPGDVGGGAAADRPRLSRAGVDRRPPGPLRCGSESAQAEEPVASTVAPGAAIGRLEGEFRIRLSSIEATEVTRELIAVMAEHPDKVCPHLHVCLQSGSDRILRDAAALVHPHVPGPLRSGSRYAGVAGADDRRDCGLSW